MSNFADLTAIERADLIKNANVRFRCKEDVYKYLSRVAVSPARSL